MQADPRAWRPQAFGPRKAKDLRDPIVEPAWDGIRVLAHVSPAGVRIVDANGADLAPDHPEIAAELLAAIAADTAVVDGYLTDQALRSGVGVTLDVDGTPGVGEHVTQFFLGSRAADAMGGRGQVPGRATARTIGQVEAVAGAAPVPIAYVAIDLLALDDEPLLDVPLLERKRLLESVLAEGDRVRRTSYVREPAGSFIITWRALGFGGVVHKEANSRYHPGAPNPDWTLMAMPRR
jgi:bifunctional non-homologous end joining protein LigD